jgi:hypothetical protein
LIIGKQIETDDVHSAELGKPVSDKLEEARNNWHVNCPVRSSNTDTAYPNTVNVFQHQAAATQAYPNVASSVP